MKLWKGRFSKETSDAANDFNASIDFDKRMYRQDIRGSIAHADMLGKQGIITENESEIIQKGLNEILEEADKGKLEFSRAQEDIHMNVESLLTEKIGSAGKKLHTARSRNDQVAVDIRLYLKDEITGIKELLTELKKTLYKLAAENKETIMPGYTHLQRAQPVTFAYYMICYYQMFRRDAERFEDCYKRMDFLPLGAGALAGTPYDTDREYLAEKLGFAGICTNAMDAVSDRDFALEFLGDCAITQMHLSRFCEELILWNSSEFGFIEMDDAFSTGSSIMPQKKNPDMAELIRGKTGRVYGDLITLLTVMKGLPLAYNKDMQEDKQPLFDAADTVKASLKIFTDMISAMKIKKENMAKAVKNGFMNATDTADYLVAKGIPFRECHEIVGNIVLYCEKRDVTIEELSLEELKRFSPMFREDIYERIKPEACIAAKKSSGSTSFKSVEKQLEEIEKELNLC
ncbi:MAG: argininosuccinate lyase [Anaerovoracaceae bacterium]